MLNNIAPFNCIEIAALFGEENLFNINEDFNSIGVVIDTRILENGNIFVALKGDNLDGNEMVAQAFHSGASACLVSKSREDEFKIKFPDKSLIFSDDSLTSLGILANHHRQRFSYPVLAIGGSNGKTTTKEMVSAVLSENFNVLKTHANFNNRIGVPLMLLQMSIEYNIAVLELGTNTPGEMYELSKIVQPTHALITNIGKEHLEFLLDLDGVELEEAYLFAQIRSVGHAFVNYDDERLKLYGQVLGKFSTYGIDKHSQFQCEYVLNSKLNPTINILDKEYPYTINMLTVGYTSALNAIASAAVATHFEIEPEKIKSALENFRPLSSENSYGRMAIDVNDNISIINDTYNANPDSMLASLRNLEMLKTDGKKFAVLGDMRELGEAAQEEHQNILEFAEKIADYILVTGTEMLKASQKLKSHNIFYFENNELLATKLKTLAKNGDSILVKGSRGMKMEEVIRMLKLK